LATGARERKQRVCIGIYQRHGTLWRGEAGREGVGTCRGQQGRQIPDLNRRLGGLEAEYLVGVIARVDELRHVVEFNIPHLDKDIRIRILAPDMAIPDRPENPALESGRRRVCFEADAVGSGASYVHGCFAFCVELRLE
jgi:hypothetical protein